MSRTVWSLVDPHQVDRADVAAGLADRRRHAGERAGRRRDLDAHGQAVGGGRDDRHRAAKCSPAATRDGAASDTLHRMATVKQAQPRI